MITALASDLRHAIGWCDLTLNPGIYGCEMVSPACGTADGSSMCYASVTAERLIAFARGRGVASPYEGTVANGRWNGTVRVDYARIAVAFAMLPKSASKRIRRVFVTSMADLFHTLVPYDFLDRVFAEMEARPWISFQVLTKRAERMAEYAADRRRRGLAWPINVWAGVTAEDQRRADERIPFLMQTPGLTFLSIEPMLSAIDLHGRLNELSWVIVGSESNGTRPGKRKTDPNWIRDVVMQCVRAGVPVFGKQMEIMGRLVKYPPINGRERIEFPDAA